MLAKLECFYYEVKCFTTSTTRAYKLNIKIPKNLGKTRKLRVV